ncbi:OmpH family outer membrane protein [Citreimonas salinaria]|uniref:Periplasmic chaperone for outer membrane proteins Skp n=1 Tax=Citreimonas salinaria TaxID=321339 RepID=A0A1H3GFZ8_9RHOB|nr:OmpH family outer membrane protein [Citreimonas salinaria]SDY02216.1 periplasmic chaperone for outer membrane proteins Skp [Citreimonas salinaria]
MLRALSLLALLLWPAALPAQSEGDAAVVRSDILVLDFERLFADSAYGRRIAREMETAGAAIAQENRRIEAELIEEERRLTRQRDDMAPADFRELAQAFDEKVQRLRSEQDAKARGLGERGDAARREFLEAAQPVLGALMRETGAQVVVERRMVFMSADAIEVTDEAIARIDAAIGEGEGLPEAPPESPPEPDVPVPSQAAPPVGDPPVAPIAPNPEP